MLIYLGSLEWWYLYFPFFKIISIFFWLNRAPNLSLNYLPYFQPKKKQKDSSNKNKTQLQCGEKGKEIGQLPYNLTKTSPNEASNVAQTVQTVRAQYQDSISNNIQYNHTHLTVNKNRSRTHRIHSSKLYVAIRGRSPVSLIIQNEMKLSSPCGHVRVQELGNNYPSVPPACLEWNVVTVVSV